MELRSSPAWLVFKDRFKGILVNHRRHGTPRGGSFDEEWEAMFIRGQVRPEAPPADEEPFERRARFHDDAWERAALEQLKEHG